jgi:hypothetical protein
MSGIDKDKLKVLNADQVKAEQEAKAKREGPPKAAKAISLKKEEPVAKQEEDGNDSVVANVPVPSSSSPFTEEQLKNMTAEEFFASVRPVPEYVKHLIECRCSLAQFRTWDDPPNHKFIVFSELDDLGNVKRSYAKCNNCDIVHRVLEVGKSETLRKESSKFLEDEDDIRPDLPAWLIGVLEQHSCEVHVWQEARYIFENKMWGRFIVLDKEREDDVVMGKVCQILGDNLHKVSTFERDEGFIAFG